MKPDWIAADWGTTRLRVWAMGADGRVLARAGPDRGMGQLDRTGYGPALLDLVGPWLGDSPDPVPVLVCGMAGARSGWAEAAYRAVPCAPLDPASATRPDGADPRLSVLILPGLSQSAPPDVMRGEETQLAGLIAARPGWNGVACLPGTHSKWTLVEDGRVIRFRTVPTGELFALLRDRSTLSPNIAAADADPAEEAAGFAEGLERAGAGRLLASLFAARAMRRVREPVQRPWPLPARGRWRRPPACPWPWPWRPCRRRWRRGRGSARACPRVWPRRGSRRPRPRRQSPWR